MIIMKTPTQCQNANREEEGRQAGHTWHTATPTGSQMEGSPVGSAEISEISMRHVNRSARRGRQGRPQKALAAVCPGRLAGWLAGRLGLAF